MENGEHLGEFGCARDEWRGRPTGKGIVRPMTFLLAGVIAGALAACGASPPLRYYTIEPSLTAVDRSAKGGPAGYHGPVLYMGALQIPPTMDRLEMLSDVQAGRVEVRELDHWAAPLARSARLALAQDLAARLPRGMLRFAGEPRAPETAALNVQVLSLKIDGGVASMSATWSIEPPAVTARDTSTSISVYSRLQAPAGPGALQTAMAWSSLLGLLADDIVAKASARSR